MEVLIHHSEIALKGKNRSFFERKLVENVKRGMEKSGIELKKIERVENRILCDVDGEKEEIEGLLKKIFGISNFSFVESCRSEIDEIKGKFENFIDKLKGSIAVRSKRSWKKFPLNSNELNRLLGDIVRNRGFKINLTDPDNIVYVEITSKRTFIYSKKVKGLNGLPVSVSGKLLCLLSGGIDSSVSPFLVMKRGCKVDFIHFHVFKDYNQVLKSKIMEIVEKLNEYQFSSNLYLVPYHQYQIMTLGKIDEKYDLVLFRNFMFRLSERIAERYGYEGLVTGDSIGQVASQTLENLRSSQIGLRIPVYRPLIGFDKEEIVEIARKIGTYDYAIKNYKDCCSIISRRPSTGISEKKMGELLERIDIDKIVEKSLSDIEVVVIE